MVVVDVGGEELDEAPAGLLAAASVINAGTIQVLAVAVGAGRSGSMMIAGSWSKVVMGPYSTTYVPGDKGRYH